MSVLKDQFVSEEVVHDAFLKAFEALPRFKGKSKFSTWFYRIVINESLKRLKKETPWNNRKSEVNEDQIVQIEDRLQEHEIEERKLYIQKVLQMLPSKESLALQLFYLNGYPVEEITQVTGWTNANTKVILHRARKNFYMTMKENFGEKIYQLL